MRGDKITSKVKVEKQNNLLRAVPNTWCKFVNSQITPCPKCKKTRSNLLQLAYEEYTLSGDQGYS